MVHCSTLSHEAQSLGQFLVHFHSYTITSGQSHPSQSTPITSKMICSQECYVPTQLTHIKLTSIIPFRSDFTFVLMAPDHKIQEIRQHLFCNVVLRSVVYSILVQYKDTAPFSLVFAWPKHCHLQCGTNKWGCFIILEKCVCVWVLTELTSLHKWTYTRKPVLNGILS
jgi:hypothetical protein